MNVQIWQLIYQKALAFFFFAIIAFLQLRHVTG